MYWWLLLKCHSLSLFWRVLIVLYVCYCLSAGWSAACLSSRSSAVCFTVPEVRPCTPSTSAPSGDLWPPNVSSRPRDPSCSHIAIQSRHVWCLQHLIRNQPALVMSHISTDLSFEMFIFIFWCGVWLMFVWTVFELCVFVRETRCCIVGMLTFWYDVFCQRSLVFFK